MEFKNKQNKGWILEEIEKKKNECLDANQFGGENPEDVEKHQEEVDKEINKRFDAVRKTAEKVVGQDFEERAKPHKVEVHYVGRKDLGEAINKLKEQNINYKINRSTKEGFRYVVEYYSDEQKKDEPLLEKIDLEEDDANEGMISGAEELSHDELANLERSLWAKFDENEIHPEDGTFSNSSNRLADLDLYALISGDWKHDHMLAEHLVEEWCKENGYVIVKHTSEEIGESDQDSYKAEHHWFLVKDTDGHMDDTVNTLHQMFTSKEDESLKEVLDDEELPDAVPEEPIVISTEPGDDVAAVVVEEPNEEVKKVGLYTALSSELRDTLQDIENLKSLTVTFVEEGREDLIDDLNAIIDERTIHSGMIQQLMTRVEGKVEAEETNTEKPAEEPEIKEESLNEDVAKREYSDEEIERAKKYQALTLKQEGKRNAGKEVEEMSNEEFIAEFLDTLGAEGLDELIDEAKVDEDLTQDQEEEIKRWAETKELNPEDIKKRITDRVNINNYSLKDAFEEVMLEVRNDGFKDWQDYTNQLEKDLAKESLEEAKEETIHLDKYEVTDDDTEEQKEDAKIMPYGDVTKSQWEEFLHNAKWPYWLDWEQLTNELRHKEQ